MNGHARPPHGALEFRTFPHLHARTALIEHSATPPRPTTWPCWRARNRLGPQWVPA